MDCTIERIANLSDDEFNSLKKDGRVSDELKHLLNLTERDYGVGDSVCLLNEPSRFKDVFKCTQENGRVLHFIVMTPLDEIRALCYTIYPKIH